MVYAAKPSLPAKTVCFVGASVVLSVDLGDLGFRGDIISVTEINDQTLTVCCL